MSRSKFRESSVNIHSLSIDGHGLGTIEHDSAPSCDIEVPSSMAGDVVRVTYKRKRKGRYQGRLEEILEPSPQRIAPKCAHFNHCGGCRWQHLPYEEQLSNKQARVRELFAPMLPEIDRIQAPIIPCDPPWNYRNKMEFSFSQDREGKRFAGLFQGRGRVFNLTECHLVDGWFAEALARARSWSEAENIPAYHPPSNEGCLRTLIVREARHSGDRLVMLTVSGRPEFALSAQQVTALCTAMKDLEPDRGHLSLFLRVQQVAKGQPTQFFEMQLSGPDHLRERLNIQGPSGIVHALDFAISPSAFFQPNTRQAEKLYSTALSLAEVTPNTHAFDLYCGTGTLGICLAKEVKSVLGVELSQESSLDARTNAADNMIENLHVITGDVGKVLTARREEPNFVSPDLVVLDPPRAGLDTTALGHLKDLMPDQVLYISCNPVSQAANIAELLEAGYVLTALQAVDQFPQTIHIENIAVLRRTTCL